MLVSESQWLFSVLVMPRRIRPEAGYTDNPEPTIVVVIVTSLCKLMGRVRDMRTGSYEYICEADPALSPTVIFTVKEPCTPPDNLHVTVVCVIHSVTSERENPADTAKVRLFGPNPVPNSVMISFP